MTPLQLARQECANWTPTGGCLGAKCLGSRTPGPLARCLLNEKKPCPYFEDCVLPLLKSHPEYADAAPDYEAWLQANARAKNQKTPSLTALKPHRKCRTCGKPVATKKLYCDACKQDRAKARTRERVRKHRDTDV